MHSCPAPLCYGCPGPREPDWGTTASWSRTSARMLGVVVPVEHGSIDSKVHWKGSVQLALARAAGWRQSGGVALPARRALQGARVPRSCQPACRHQTGRPTEGTRGWQGLAVRTAAQAVPAGKAQRTALPPSSFKARLQPARHSPPAAASLLAFRSGSRLPAGHARPKRTANSPLLHPFRRPWLLQLRHASTMPPAAAQRRPKAWVAAPAGSAAGSP